MKKTINKKELKMGKSKCEISGVDLQKSPELIDINRIVPKSEGGTIADENIRVVDPVEHQKLQGAHHQKNETAETLRALIDDRNQVTKLKVKIDNQKTAYLRRTDTPSETSLEILDETYSVVVRRLKEVDKKVKALIKTMKKTDPLVAVMLEIEGVGEITIANLINYIDFDIEYPDIDETTGFPHARAGQKKAKHISSLWKYCGYHAASHKRHKKGVAGGGNKVLRSLLYNTASSMIKCNSPYKEIYNREKAKLSISKKITKSRNNQGQLIECMWKDTMPNHRHMAAIRKMLKIFLAHFWIVARTLRNEPVAAPYVQDKLGHASIITPEEMGWNINIK